MALGTLGLGTHSLQALANIPFTPSPKMPVLFLGHGSPMNAIEDNLFTKNFKKLGEELPKPQAILCISAHWFISGTKVTAMDIPKTIHDFGGFPQALFDVRYPASGSPELADTTAKLLSPTPVELDHSWGLDHGAWSVIKHLYPKADIPVIQMSIDYRQKPEFHFELGKQLSALREKGVLIVGSGNIIHNLRKIDFQNINKLDYGYDWAIEAHSAVNSHINNGNFTPLINYLSLGKAMALAAPTPDHYLPLLYTLGLKQKNESITLFNDYLLAGSMSMTSLKIG